MKVRLMAAALLCATLLMTIGVFNSTPAEAGYYRGYHHHVGHHYRGYHYRGGYGFYGGHHFYRAGFYTGNYGGYDLVAVWRPYHFGYSGDYRSPYGFGYGAGYGYPGYHHAYDRVGYDYHGYYPGYIRGYRGPYYY